MNVLVIGASSFVGVYTVKELLDHGVNVVGTGRNPNFAEHYRRLGVPYLYLDVCAPDSFSVLNAYNFDAVVSCAALMPSNVRKSNDDADDIVKYLSVNVIGIYNVLEYCRKISVPRVVAFTSQFDTRLHATDKVITEGTQLKFSYTDDHAGYVISNNGKLQVMTYYNEKYQMKNIVMRLPTILGVGPHGSFHKDGVYTKSGMQIFIECASEGAPIDIFGDPNTSKDILYVKDLAIGIRQALQSETAAGLYNIGYDRNFSLIEIVKSIVTVFSPADNKSEIRVRADLPNNGSFPHMSIDRAKKDFSFAPEYTSFESIMADYKRELQGGTYSALFGG